MGKKRVKPACAIGYMNDLVISDDFKPLPLPPVIHVNCRCCIETFTVKEA